MVDRCPRNLRAFEYVDQEPEDVKRHLRRGNWVIGTEQKFVKHTPFGHVAHRVVIGPWPVKIGPDIREEITVFTDHHEAIDLPGVTRVREHHLQVWKGGGDPVDVTWMRKIKIGELLG